MKAVIVALIGTLSLMVSIPSVACYSGTTNCQQLSQSCSESPSGCQCSDPACRIGNDCLSESDCCRAFGNMGAS